MKVLSVSIFLAVSMTVGCGGGSASPTTPSAATMTGAWTGTASDSTTSMMGTGLTASMMANTTWTMTQTGDAFSGTMRFTGYMGPPMIVSGTMNGHSGTFTMTAPAGSMMMSNACMATATGTFDMDDMMTQFHGTYTGMNSCTGAFDHGQISMHR